MTNVLFQTGTYIDGEWHPDGEPFEAHPDGESPWRGFPNRTALEEHLMAEPGAVRLSPDVIEYESFRGVRIRARSLRIRAIFPADDGAPAC